VSAEHRYSPSMTDTGSCDTLIFIFARFFGLRWIGLVFALSCSADHYAAKGKQAVDAHELASAEGHFRAGLGRDPSHLASLSGLGWVYLLAGQHDAANAAFEHCLATDDEHLDCLRGSAGVASAKANPAMAKTRLTKALRIAPHDAGVISSLALLALGQGDMASALGRYQTLVDRQPDKAEYRLGLAEVLLRTKRFKDALSQIQAGLVAGHRPKRTTAMLFQTQSRVLVAAAAKGFDAGRCAETTKPVLAWLDAAEAAIQNANQIGVKLPDLPVVGRRARRQRARVASACPEQSEFSDRSKAP